MATLMCPQCTDVLDVGDEKNSIIALCMNGRMVTLNGRPLGPGISACKGDLWGSAKTRADVASKDGIVRHVVQTDPPEHGPREMRG